MILAKRPAGEPNFAVQGVGSVGRSSRRPCAITSVKFPEVRVRRSSMDMRYFSVLVIALRQSEEIA